MFSNLGRRMVGLDLDPQAHLTAALLDEDQLEPLWENLTSPATIYHAVQPLTALGDLQEPLLHNNSRGLHLIPGDVALGSPSAKGTKETTSLTTILLCALCVLLRLVT